MSQIPTADNLERAGERRVPVPRIRGAGLNGASPPGAAREPGADEAFDRLARMAAGLLDAPGAFVAMVEDGEPRIVGSVAPAGQPIDPAWSHKVAGRVIAAGTPLRVLDPSCTNGAPGNTGQQEPTRLSCLGVPILASDGRALGAVGVVAAGARHWSDVQALTLQDVAAAARTEIEMREVTGGVTRDTKTAGVEQTERPSDDFAERRQAEGRLRQVLSRVQCLVWEAAVEDLGDELDWKLTMWDDEASQRFMPLDVPPGTDYGEAWHLSKPVQDRDRMARTGNGALRSGKTRYTQEFRCRERGGAERWFWEDVHITQLDEANWRLVGVCTDITERKRSEALAGGQNHILELIATGAPLTMVLEAICLGIEDGSPESVCSIHILPQGGRQLTLGAAPSLPESYRRAIEGMAVGPQAGSCGTAVHRRHEVLVTDIETDPLWSDCRWLAIPHGLRACWSVPVYASTGEILGVLSVYYRETRGPAAGERLVVYAAARLAGIAIERKQAEDTLLLRDRTLEAVSEGIVIADALQADYPIVYANSSVTALTGYTTPEIVGRNSRFLQGPETDPEVAAGIRDALRRETPVSAELLNYRKDGTPFWNALSIAPVRDVLGRTTHFVGVQVDVTGKKQLEEQLRQSQKMEAVGRLAGGVAHDFNNMLAVINGYSDLLLPLADRGSPLFHGLEQIQRAGMRAAELTRQLLAYSRKQMLTPEVLDLNATVMHLGKLLSRLIGEDLHLETDLDPRLGRVKADGGQIEQVILNLAVNARDAMPQGGKLTIRTENVDLDEAACRRHKALRPGKYAVLTIRDDGSGIEPAIQALIFEPFFTTKEQGKGTGLGLSTVYGIVEQSGGLIDVESFVGIGSTFRVYLPRLTEEISDSEDPACPREPGDGTETILLVEDEEMVRRLVCEILQSRGYHVLVAAGGDEAQHHCDAHSGTIDLLLTDVVMPGMSGTEIVKCLSVRRPRMKVLYMTGYTDDVVVQHGVSQAGTALIQKPFAPTALACKVREVLDELPPAR